MTRINTPSNAVSPTPTPPQVVTLPTQPLPNISASGSAPQISTRTNEENSISTSTTAAQPSQNLTPLEHAVEAVANNPLLDIVLLASNKKRDVIQRSIDGNWLVAGNKVCVDIGPLVKADGKAIPLKFFKEITTQNKSLPSELRPVTFYQMLSSVPAKSDISPNTTKSGFNGPTPITSSGIPVKPKPVSGPSKAERLNSALADGMEAGLAKKFGKKITTYYVAGGTGCTPDAYAVPRAYMDAMTGPLLSAQWRSGIEKRDYAELVEIPVSLFRQVIAESTDLRTKLQQDREAALKKLAQSPSSGEKALYTALNIGRGRIDACSVVPSEANAPSFDVPIEALMQTEQFKTFLPGRPNSQQRFKNIDELFADLQLPKGTCTVILGNGPTIAQLTSAVDRDGQFDARIMPHTITGAQLTEVHARALGFESGESYIFATSVGIKNSQDAAQLNTLGIRTKVHYQAALKRLADAGLDDPQTTAGLIYFLRDEKEALAKSTTIRKLRAARLASEQAETRKNEQAQALADKKKAAEFPYVAYISCMVGTQKTRVEACMSSKNVSTEIELKNGSDYRMYKMFEVQNLGTWNGAEIVVDLRSQFTLKAQNADDTLVLNVTIKNRSNGDIIFQKSAAKFGVIAVRK